MDLNERLSKIRASNDLIDETLRSNFIDKNLVSLKDVQQREFENHRRQEARSTRQLDLADKIEARPPEFHGIR
jgi:hypothetical protein